VISNDIFCNCLRMSGRTGVIASEEEATPVAVEETDSGNYIVVFDPLDGSSNIDAGEECCDFLPGFSFDRLAQHEIQCVWPGVAPGAPISALFVLHQFK
jgi:fructose-1,6-bisphosphatase I